MNLENTFEVNEKNNNSSKVKEIIDRIQNAHLNIENFEEWFTESQTNSRILTAQIDNKTMDFKESKEDGEIILAEAKEKGELNKEFIPLSLFEAQKKIYQNVMGVLSWHVLLAKQQKILLDKSYDLLKEAKSSRITHDALKETKEFIKEQNNLVKDIVNNQITNIQEKIMSSAREMNKETNLIQKENIIIITNTIDKFAQNNTKNIQSIGNILLEFSHNQKESLKENEESIYNSDYSVKSEAETKLKENLSVPAPVTFPKLIGDTLMTEEVEVELPEKKEEGKIEF